MSTPVWTRLDSLPERAVLKGVYLRILPGEKLMYSIVRLEPHATVPTHHHPHEQLSYIIDGEMELWINEERRIVRRGDLAVIPSDVPHGARTHDTTCLVLDAFHPVREEYIKLFK